MRSRSSWPSFILFIVVATGLAPLATAQDFFNGFEDDVAGWDVFGAFFTPTRVSSGTNGIPSSSGDWHAEVNNDGDCSGNAAGNWGGYTCNPGCASAECAAGTFPDGGYFTSADIYLDVDGGWSNDTRFDLSSAISRPDGNHRRDFVFNAGFYDDGTGPGAGTDRFVISASTNACRANTFPKNPDKDPIAISETGWYTFEHQFRDDGGVLAVDLTIRDAGGNVVNQWTISDPTDVIDVTVGGNRYGWFVTNEFSTLAFDQTQRACGPREGACCNGETCRVISEEECVEHGFVFQGAGTTCDPNPCFGACCIDGICHEGTQERCLENGGTYQGDGTRCSQGEGAPCFGACCLEDHPCHEGTQRRCMFHDGEFQGDGSRCADEPCGEGE